MKTIGLAASRSMLVVIAALSVACTATTPTLQTGPDAELSFEGLHKVNHSAADLAWARPDFDISSYTKIMLVSEGIEYAPVKNRSRTARERTGSSGPYFISDEAKARFEETVRETFADEMRKIEGFEIVTEAGPDVMMVRGMLLNVASYIPFDTSETVGRSSVYLRQVGEATLVLELRDSESGTILARSVDRRVTEAAGGTFINSNRVTNAAEVRRLVRSWGRRLREGLDGFRKFA